MHGLDPYTQPVKAVLDPTTGFALLVTNEYCLVWNWSQVDFISLPFSPCLSRTVYTHILDHAMFVDISFLYDLRFPSPFNRTSPS